MKHFERIGVVRIMNFHAVYRPCFARPRRCLAALLLLIPALIAGCGGGGGGPFGNSSSSAPTVSSIVVVPASATLNVGQSKQLNVTANFSNGTSQDVTSAVTWTSNAASVASVSNTTNPGVVTALAAGTATVTATYPSNNLTSTCAITVNAGSSTLVSIAITPNVTSIALNTRIQLTATGTFASNTANITPNVTWNSSNPSAITVNSSGVVNAVGMGTAIISATDPTTSIQATITLTVTSATLQSITVTPQNPSVNVGLTVQLTAQGKFSDGSTQDLTPFANWSTQNAAVATVSNTGLVTAVSAGSITITATDATTNISATTTVTVK